MNSIWTQPICRLAVATSVILFAPLVSAQSALPAAAQAKADTYKAKLVDWAANPTILAAAREANAKGSLPGMTNGKWSEVDDKDAIVKSLETSPAGILINKWEADKNVNKLVLRDQKGNLVASSLKPLVYNVAARPPFINAIKGAPWTAGEIKPDPSTGVKSVQVSAPVLDGDKVIGVLHAAISVD